MTLTHFSLFTGIGGIDLSAEWAGFETVGQCEWADYPTKVLEKHWPDVPRWRDIRSVTKQSIEEAGINGVTIISGGFPCQPFSVAGKRRGKEDDRYLWPEMLRVISELRPDWVIGENVPGIVKMALDQVCSDLENENYKVQPFIIPAGAVDAPHYRDRVWMVANSNRKRLEGLYDERNGISLQLPKGFREEWETEPRMDRVALGIPNRVDRLKCLGNAVVPQQVYPILQAIADIEQQYPISSSTI
jgi:DNA (cytosine-5)-methyltransferase 1